MKPYLAYKDSGVEWLGVVPEGWEVMPVKAVASIINGYPFNSASFNSTVGLPLVRIRDLNQTESEARFDGHAIEQAIISNSDVLIGMDGDFNVGRWLGDGPALLNQRMCCVRAGSDTLTRFIEYCLPFPLKRINDVTYSTTVKHLSSHQVEKIRIALPPSDGAITQIVTFLDRETAKIDGMIEEQRRLIALLAEKRQATISHAVTRGLNPSARLKPSGVDWLGDIPEGWEVVPLKRKSPEITVGIVVEPSKYYVESGVPALRSLNVRPGRISGDNMVYISDNANELMSKSMLRHGDVVAVRTGQPGTCAVVPQEFDGANCIDLIIVRRSAQLDSEYLVWFLTSDPALRQFSEGSGGAIQLHFNVSAAKDILVSCPPLDEQREIAAYLSRITAQLDTLTETATSAITLLQERRAALISAAVTGKIDVRELAKVPAQAPQSLHVSAMVAGVIIARHGQHLGFGRMMVQKFLFMTQACANAPEIGGDYERQAAGPLDRDLQSRVETDLEAAGLVRVRQEGGPGSRVQYEFLGDAAALHAELASALGDRMERFDYLSNQLGSLTKNGIEAVATLYAAWNDFLIDGRTPDRADIIREVLENWHPEKSRKFTADELGTWLDWMERQNIVPDGTGPQTQTGRLFP
uniref:restriction endonuclease subunit S n=1 Tax=Paracoccus sp. TRP TaxID=412597 RepID=UPI000225FA26|nr:restriction endonuclease subunit S [Paracoccus sp. TRP]